ncbi:hypothetical protein AB8A24_36150, partial [Streptomyces sp. BF23-19]
MGCAREYGREVLLGPLTEGLDVPRDLDLDLDFGDRARALDRLHALTTPLAARPAPPTPAPGNTPSQWPRLRRGQWAVGS